jgi:hypothetical protein
MRQKYPLTKNHQIMKPTDEIQKSEFTNENSEKRTNPFDFFRIRISRKGAWKFLVVIKTIEGIVVIVITLLGLFR